MALQICSNVQGSCYGNRERNSRFKYTMNLDVVVRDLLRELVDCKVVGWIQDGQLRKIIGKNFVGISIDSLSTLTTEWIYFPYQLAPMLLSFQVYQN